MLSKLLSIGNCHRLPWCPAPGGGLGVLTLTQNNGSMKFQNCHAEGEGAAAQRGDLRIAAIVSTRGMCLSVSPLVFLFAKRIAMKGFAL